MEIQGDLNVASFDLNLKTGEPIEIDVIVEIKATENTISCQNCGEQIFHYERRINTDVIEFLLTNLTDTFTVTTPTTCNCPKCGEEVDMIMQAIDIGAANALGLEVKFDTPVPIPNKISRGDGFHIYDDDKDSPTKYLPIGLLVPWPHPNSTPTEKERRRRFINALVERYNEYEQLAASYEELQDRIS